MVSGVSWLVSGACAGALKDAGWHKDKVFLSRVCQVCWFVLQIYLKDTYICIYRPAVSLVPQTFTLIVYKYFGSEQG